MARMQEPHERYNEPHALHSGIERARAYLRQEAEHLFDSGCFHWSDLEVVSYLASRGEISDLQQTSLQEVFTINAEHTIREAFQIGEDQPAELSDIQIEFANEYELPDFWTGQFPGDPYVNSVVIKVASLCGIKGLDGWWSRFAVLTRNSIMDSCFRNYHGALMAFHLARSDFALSLLNLSAELLCGELMRGINEEYDLRSDFNLKIIASRPEAVTDHIHLAAVAFVAKRFGIELFGAQQINMICRHLQSGTAFLDVQKTAIALHFLGILRPRNWECISRQAIDYLWNAQKENGSWHLQGTPGPRFLTAFVLDSIDLAEGRSPLTFSSEPTINGSLDSIDTPHFDGIDLSHRGKKVLRLSKKATNLISILSSFESVDWHTQIENPLVDDVVGQKMRDAIHDLNEKQNDIHFEANGGGGIWWSICGN